MSVVVLGMHRSGTSLATALVAAAGHRNAPAESTFSPGEFNAKGNQEVVELWQLNETLLRAFNGSWSAPPLLPAGWPSDRRAASLSSQARSAFVGSLGSRGWVWKDPRSCLTLPFWEAVIPDDYAILLVRRNPLETAASLARRNGFSTSLSLALWEHYLRSALQNSQRKDVMIVDYETLLDDPVGWVMTIHDQLTSAGHSIGEPRSREEILRFTDEQLRHTQFGRDDLDRDLAVSPQQRELHDLLSSFETDLRPFEIRELPAPTPWVEALLSERRAAAQLRRPRVRVRVARRFMHARRTLRGWGARTS